MGIDLIFDAILKRIPASKLDLSDTNLRLFLFDARYVATRGVMCLVKVMNGVLRLPEGRAIMSYNLQKRFDLFECGVVNPDMVLTNALYPGQVGYFLSNMKTVKEAMVGDTFYLESTKRDLILPFPGYDPPQCMVFAGIYPEDPIDYEELEKALMKLCLRDGSVTMGFEASTALGSGFRCGFLGMLHLDVFRQMLEDEYDQVAIITQPSITYKCKVRNIPELITVNNPTQAPAEDTVEHWHESIVTANIISPNEYAKDIMALCDERRGQQVSVAYM